jgi:hypothetical protein
MTPVEAPGDPIPPPYGRATLAELVPSILAALGAGEFENPLRLEPMEAACLLMVDGLGWEQLVAHRHHAPFLSSGIEAGRSISTPFPSTTATSLGCLGTGRSPGEHGLVGYTFAVPGHERPINVLHWALAGPGPHIELRDEFPPERAQPHATAFERAPACGAEAIMVGPPSFARSGLTRAAFRPRTYLSAYSLGDVIATIRTALPGAGPTLVSAYHPDLDVTGHVRGVGSDAWTEELGIVDRLAEVLASRLPRGTTLLVTGDHGMVNLSDEQKVELSDHPSLLSGVRMLAGEPRARYVFVRPGAESDVLAAWRARLGDRMWILARDEALALGLFGGEVAPEYVDRIGDVVAIARGEVGVLHREVDGVLATLASYHGSVTDDERLVPLLEFRR